MWKSTITCERCGEAIKLQSFRAPPLKCPHCNQYRNPDDEVENEAFAGTMGCLLFAPFAIGAALLCGFAGAAFGRWLGPRVQNADLRLFFAFLFGVDGFALIVYLWWRVVGGPKSRQVLAPLAVFAVFGLIGLKTARGMGLHTALIAGVANGILGMTVVYFLFPRTEQNSDTKAPDSTTQ